MYPGLRYTYKKLRFNFVILEKCLFEYKIRFLVEQKHKKKKFGPFLKLSGKISVFAIIKMLFIHFPYIEIV